jgi:hypothetical protein
MTKNAIISGAVTSLTTQREALTKGLTLINFSDTNAMVNESCLKAAISDIDFKIDILINSCESYPPTV